MSRPNLRSATLSLLLMALLSPPAGLAARTDSGEPIRVTHTISIRNGNWIPLAVEDMRRAAGDAALSRLTDAGRLALVAHEEPRAKGEDLGSLALEIALIGPAETAKLTITLDVTGSPTLVSTASISVRALDHAGIYDALEHVGIRAADRLAAKLDLLQRSRRAGEIGLSALEGDPERRRAYDQAQVAKREGRYEEARVSFEAIVASGGEGSTDALGRLAEDELRYGLPLFEAQQALNALGRMVLPGQQDHREEALARAENLYRQIQAENPSSVQRVTEAQRALDSLIVTRGALANAMRATALSRLQSLRFAMLEFSMMEGECPGKERVLELASSMKTRVELEEIVPDGDRAKRYKFKDSSSNILLELRCDDSGIEFVGADSRSRGFPAAFR